MFSREGCMGLRGVSDERLKKRGADVLLIGIAAETPDLVGEDADGPASLLDERDEGRPEAPFFRPEKAIGLGRVVAHRTEAPDEAAGAGRLGREEEALGGIAKARSGCRTGQRHPLANDRKDGRRIRFQSLLMEIGITG